VKALALAVLCALATALAFACDEGQPLQPGAHEPIHVRGATFFSGPLPGAAPVEDAGPMEAGAPPDGVLLVTDVKAVNAVVSPGQAAKTFTGRTSKAAMSVGMRIDDMGTGYWALPVQEEDPMFPGEYTWEAAIDFDLAVTPGYHHLIVAALGPNGTASQQVSYRVCIASRIPDNLNACEPTLQPPAAVISLQWSSDVDLDLQVTLPDGRVVEPKSPLTQDVEAGRPPPEVGQIDRDSLYACIPDGLRQEDLVWQKRPPNGAYDVAVNMFDACKKSGTTFTVIVYEADGDPPNQHLIETYRKSGQLTSLDANGGASPGLFVFEYPF
jgi:hypothetical protein